MVKRFFDIVFSILGLLLLTPFFLIIGLLIKLGSRGPMFYRGIRVGKNGKPFRIWKFHTMIENPLVDGPQISIDGDPRVTTLGRILCRLKINELPQLINVLKGEMSFVGPRPEVPKFIQFYTEEQRKILFVRPGIVGPNQILNRNEGEQFPLGVDTEQFYITHILPKKLKIDLEYIENASFLTDIKYLLIGLKATILGWLSRRLIFQNWSQIVFFLTDLVLCIVSYLAAYFLRFEDFIPGNELSVFFQTLPILLILQMTSLVYFGIYQTLIRHISTETMVDVIKAISISSLLLWSYILLFGPRGHSRAILLIDWVLLIGFIGGSRLVTRMLREQFTSVETHKERKILIFGAGTVGELALRTLKAEKNVHFNVMGFVDDNPRKRYKKIKGIKVLGDRYSLDYLVKLYQIDELIVAVSDITSEDLRHVLSLCQKAHTPYKIFPTAKDLSSESRYGYGLRHIGISNLIGSKEIHIDLTRIRDLLEGKRIMVIGAGGAVGSEICRQVALFSPERLILLEQNEAFLKESLIDLRGILPSDKVSPFLCGMDHPKKLERIISKHRPHIIFYTALRKDISLMEQDPEEAVKTNVLGTRLVADLASQFQVPLFVMISSIFASRPLNILGATMALAEMYIESLRSKANSQFVIVRLPSIIEAKGGDLTLFQKKIEQCEKISISHPDARRYFLSAFRATQLILQTLAMTEDSGMKDNGIYILRADRPWRLVDLAEEMIRLRGFRPGADVEIEFTGLQPGEKNFEEFVLEENGGFEGDGILETSHEHIMIFQRPSGECGMPFEIIRKGIEELGELIARDEWAGDEEATRIRAKLKELVPEYRYEP